MIKERSLKEEARVKHKLSLGTHNRLKSAVALSVPQRPLMHQRTGDVTMVELNTVVHFPPLTKFSVRHPDSANFGNDKSYRDYNPRGRALIVDDDPFNILALESLLKKYGLSIDSAYNGHEAIEKIQAKSKAPENLTENDSSKHVVDEGYDIIFMDCEMPIMNGLETASVLTRMMERGEIEVIPIIGCTGHRGHDDLEKCYESGMVDVLGKPVSREKLKECLIEFLELNI